MDGTLLPCPDWRRRRDPWSVKHGSAGMNVRILVRLDGEFMWASDPYPGSMHDVAALDASGLLEGIDPSGWIGDKGYIGRGMITPHKKPPNGELSETEKEENRSVNRIRRAERAHHRPHQVLENPPHTLPPTPGNIRADHRRSTRTLFLQDHPLNNLPGTPLSVVVIPAGFLPVRPTRASAPTPGRGPARVRSRPRSARPGPGNFTPSPDRLLRPFLSATPFLLVQWRVEERSGAKEA
ncbi:transposase family protein [Actinomyces dentalis]|uniref:transposase family protein n=1 Tax=Actinomyces dentalis TaxID=272548 RepID=UPI0028E4EDE8|nr:transposase family protein [Actinomyces dentalis]